MPLQHVFILGVILFEMATGNSEIKVDGKFQSFQEYYGESGRMPAQDEIAELLSEKWLPYAGLIASAIVTPAENRFVDTAALEGAFLALSAHNSQPQSEPEGDAKAQSG